MNKAFTANINDQVTARGYLDENNQLIMLEPEGSGGSGGDFKTVKCEIENNTTYAVAAAFGVVYDNGETHAATVLNNADSRAVDLIMYKGAGTVYIQKAVDNAYNIITSDNIVLLEDSNLYLVTGPCKFTIDSGSNS